MSTGHRLRSAAGAALAALATGPAFAQPVHEDFKLIASDGAELDRFGTSVAISGTTAIVGAIGDRDNGQTSGSVYLIDLSDPDNIIETKLIASDGAPFARFGSSVAILGTIAVVGAATADGPYPDRGAAYLFDFSDPDNIIEINLTRPDLFTIQFGNSVAISGTTAIVGAWDESAYLFDISDLDNIVETVLTASDAQQNDLDSFGWSVAISGTTAIVGAYEGDDNGDRSGSAYLFDFSDPDNIVETKLAVSDGAPGDFFGYSVAISGTTAIVGAPQDEDNGFRSGSAYVFDISDRENIVETKLTASDGAAFDSFGYSVAISGTTAIVGANDGDGSSTFAGSAYVFDFSNAGCITETKLTASDGRGYDEFGHAVAISGTTAIVGAPRDDDNGQTSGSAYVFDVTPPCAADLNSDDAVDFFDVSAFLTAFNDQDPAADFNCDTRYDFFDVAAFIVAFGRGCP